MKTATKLFIWANSLLRPMDDLIVVAIIFTFCSELYFISVTIRSSAFFMLSPGKSFYKLHLNKQKSIPAARIRIASTGNKGIY